MAIKGKKKSQQRGSQARRRPATAPRPVAARGLKVPWYKTTKGQTLAAIGGMILLVVVLVAVNNARTKATEKEQAQEALENYTEQVRALLQRITPPASEMAAVSTTAPDNLAREAEGWTTAFTAAQTETAQFFAPEGATTAGELFAQSVSLFKAAAETFAIAADLGGKQQTDLLAAAVTQVQSAAGVWDSATAALEDARDVVDLGASGLRSPTAAPPTDTQAPAAPSVEVPIETERKSKNRKGDGSDG